MYIGTSCGEEELSGVRRKRSGKRTKKDTEQVYDKNAFATIDNLRKTLYHIYCTQLLKTLKKCHH